MNNEPVAPGPMPGTLAPTPNPVILPGKGVQVMIPGHMYYLPQFNQPLFRQEISFINKRPIAPGSTELETVHDGTTNEAVLEMMIDRLKFLNNKVPSRETALAITKIEEALMWLEKRTAERKQRGVEGTNAK